jgi:uncharacterized protein (DUF362 family)
MPMTASYAKRWLRYFCIASAIAVWLWWDLTQAHVASLPPYRSFADAREVSLKSPAMTTVSIVRSDDAALANPCPATEERISYTTIAQMVRRAVDVAGGLHAIVRSGDRVLIKPNLVQQDSSGSGGVTDVRVVKALVSLVDEIDHGKIAILVGDGSPRPCTAFEKASGTTQKAWKQLFDVPGYQLLKAEALAAGIDFRLTNLNGNSETDPWAELDTVAVPGGGTAQPQGGKYFIHRDVTHADVYITVPVMKIHKEPGFTGALKNQIGIAPSSRYGFNKTTGVLQEGRAHRLLHLAQAPYNWQDKEIVDLSAIARIRFVVVDAIACLESDKSPKYTVDSANVNISNRVKMNTIIAGVDPVAVDHVCCRIVGLNPDDIEHITLAERIGLGTNNPDSIVVAGTSIAQTRKVFKKGLTWSGLYGQGNRTWLLNGPYASSGVANPMSTEFIAQEAMVTPSAGVGGWSQPLYFTNDQVMLGDYYLSKGISTANVVSYAFAYVNAPADQRAELWIGSDEALKVYLNGSVVYNYSGIRTFAGTEDFKDTITVSLRKGTNTLLVKILQSVATYNFSVNICDVAVNESERGNRVWGLKFLTDPGTPTLVETAGTPEAYRLEQNFPNPFNPETQIGYSVAGTGHEAPGASWVRLSVYDMLGREVAVLADQREEPGFHTVRFNAGGLSSGIYFYQLTADGFHDVKKMMVLR